ncbi:hypothetical protein E1B28_006126 [Marasmius oreades]|nr:uncharacterized protein E1B28_006126 [Marasmius oreades]KAG7095368.1 hypothetical protein E1B28_006126 [Marasmius oreades]
MAATVNPLPPFGMPLLGGSTRRQSFPVVPQPQYLASPMTQNVGYAGSSVIPQVPGGYGAASYSDSGVYGGTYNTGGYGRSGYGAASYPDLGSYGSAYTGSGYGGGGYGAASYPDVGSPRGAYTGNGYGGYGGPYLMPPRQNNPSVIIIDNGRRRHRSHSHGGHHHHHGHGHGHSHSHSRSHSHSGRAQYADIEYPGNHGSLRRMRSCDSL